MYNQPNYAAYAQMGGQQQAMQQQQQAMMVNMRNMQMQKLMNAFPQTAFHKETANGKEYRVPIQLSVSPQPLFVKLTLGPQFPYVKPIIQAMARVTHPNIEPRTYMYKGQALAQWRETSQLDVLLRTIQQEFQQKPPMPEGQAGQPMQTVAQAGFQTKIADNRYHGEQLNLQKPQLRDLKGLIGQMPPGELQSLAQNKEALMGLYMDSPEVKALQDKLF